MRCDTPDFQLPGCWAMSLVYGELKYYRPWLSAPLPLPVIPARDGASLPG